MRNSVRWIGRRLFALSLFIRFSAVSFSIILPLLGTAVVSSRLTSSQVLGLIGVAIAFHIFAYVLNDVIDLPVDRTELLRADFPLVQGTIQPGPALVVALLQIPVALLLTLWLAGNGMAYATLIAACVFMTVYDIWGKRVPFPPLTDFIQGLSWGTLILYGGAIGAGRWTWQTGVICTFVVVFTLMVNGVHGSLRDLTNDLNCGVRTTAIFLGVRPLGTRGLVMPLPFRLYALTLQVLLISILLFPLAYDWGGYQSSTWSIAAVSIFSLLSLILLLACAVSIDDYSRMTYLGTAHIVTSLSSLLLLFAPYMNPRLLSILLVVYIVPLCSIAGDWLIKGMKHLNVHATMMERVIGIVQLLYLDISILTALYTLLGAYLGSGITALLSPTVLRAALVVGLIVSASFVINACRDVAVDSLNDPKRPLPSGRVSHRVAAIIALLLALTALGVAVTLGPLLAAIALFNLGLSTLYSYYLKGTVLLSNMAIAFLDASIVVYGSLAAGTLSTRVWVVFILIFLYVLAQEILYAVRDQEGDARTGLRTTATQLGTKMALYLFRFVALGFVTVALLVWFLRLAPDRYLYAVVPCCVLPIIGIVILLSRRATSSTVGISLRVINLVWVLSLLPVVLLK